MNEILMSFYDRDMNEIVIIADNDENLFVLNKDKQTVVNYNPMSSLIDVFNLINFEEDVYINPDQISGLSFYIGENADEMESRLVFNMMNVLKKQNYNEVKNDEKNICPVCHNEIEYDFEKYEQYGVADGGYVPWICKNCGSKGIANYKSTFDHHDINENGLERIYEISKRLIDGIKNEHDVEDVVTKLSKMMKEKNMNLDEIDEMCCDDSVEVFDYISNI